jgi:hypothetical protein
MNTILSAFHRPHEAHLGLPHMACKGAHNLGSYMSEVHAPSCAEFKRHGDNF